MLLSQSGQSDRVVILGVGTSKYSELKAGHASNNKHTTI